MGKPPLAYPFVLPTLNQLPNYLGLRLIRALGSKHMTQKLNKLAGQRYTKKVASTFTITLLLFLAACNGTRSAANQSEVTPAVIMESPSVPMDSSAVVTPALEMTAEPQPTTPTSTAELSRDALRNATYNDILGEAVTLVDGQYEGEPFVAGGVSRPVVTLLPETIAYGDLDGDGRLDAAVVLASDSGGSGTFIYLAAVESRDGAPLNVATTLLGDRDQVRSLTIDGGRLLVNLLSHAPDDPACCPSQETIRTFRLRNGVLVDETIE